MLTVKSRLEKYSLTPDGLIQSLISENVDFFECSRVELLRQPHDRPCKDGDYKHDLTVNLWKENGDLVAAIRVYECDVMEQSPDGNTGQMVRILSRPVYVMNSSGKTIEIIQ